MSVHTRHAVVHDLKHRVAAIIAVEAFDNIARTSGSEDGLVASLLVCATNMPTPLAEVELIRSAAGFKPELPETSSTMPPPARILNWLLRSDE